MHAIVIISILFTHIVAAKSETADIMELGEMGNIPAMCDIGNIDDIAEPKIEGDPENADKLKNVIDKVKETIKSKTGKNGSTSFMGIHIRVRNKRLVFIVKASGKEVAKLEGKILNTLGTVLKNEDLFDGKVDKEMLKRLSDKNSDITRFKITVPDLKISDKAEYDSKETSIEDKDNGEDTEEDKEMDK